MGTGYRRAPFRAGTLNVPFPSLPAPLQRALDARGYQEPTPVQAAVLVEETRGRDLLVSARTGSGKTVAFGLSMAKEILEAEQTKPRALVVAPTRELALQVSRELTWLYAETPIRVVACVGGMDPRWESRALASGVQLIVGTPGRLCDHLDRGSLDLSQIRTVVLDEADEMLDMGFREELEHLLDATPSETRRSLLFSATIPSEIESLAKRYQKNAMRIATADTQVPHADIQYRLVPIAPREREHAIVNLLRFLDPKGALIFCATREGVNHLFSALLERGFAATALSGELTQAERGRALTALRDGRAKVLVATDVAARGLDLPALDLVIHADLPFDGQTLLHRSGRTGRAGRKGVACILAANNRMRIAERLLRDAKVVPTIGPPPSADSIRAKDRERLVTEILEMPEGTEEDLEVAASLLEKSDPKVLASVLVRILKGQRPEPEELPETEAMVRKLQAPKPVGTRKPGAWFRVNIGKEEAADLRWLIPLICRRGKIHKASLGEIQIRQTETWFEVAPDVAEQFASAAFKPDKKTPGVRFVKEAQAPASQREGRKK